MFFVSLRHGQVEGEAHPSPASCGDVNSEFYLRQCSEHFDIAGDPVIMSNYVQFDIQLYSYNKTNEKR
jgi:hypothetical protein